MEWEVGVSRCKLLYIEWINNKILLYSTETYIRYPMKNHNGKEYLKKRTYIYIYMFYSGTLLRTIAWETASQIALRNCPKEVREEPGYIGVFAEKTNM